MLNPSAERLMETIAKTKISEAGGEEFCETLLLRWLSFDFLNHNGLRTASLINLAVCDYFISSKR
jgi:hypothetical protein